MTEEERMKQQLLKLQELQVQMEALKTAEPNSIGQAGLLDDIKSRLRVLELMSAINVEERNEFDRNIRSIISPKPIPESNTPAVQPPADTTPTDDEYVY